jgi:protoporphyrin/coproporphyrin ferrochelatase
MNYFTKEPQYQHGDPPKIGVILANLGTPDSLSTQAVRKYLQQFLMDRRVVEVPRFIWCWILHFIILVFRPGSSAKKYAKVWTKKGSPLLVNATNQTKALTAKIKKSVSQPIEIELGMSYGNPSMKNAVLKLKEKNCTKILLLPLYPQYAASSSASAMDALWRVLLKTRNVPGVRTVRNYHDHPLYINALKLSVLQFWEKKWKAHKVSHELSWHSKKITDARRSLSL